MPRAAVNQRRAGGLARGTVVSILLSALAVSLAACGRPTSSPVEEHRHSAFDAPSFPIPAPGSYALPPIQPAADGHVLDADGERRRLGQYLDGRLALLSFVYTRCVDGRGCPLATAVLQEVDRRLAARPALAARVRLVTLSFDPEHDTPAVMRRHAGQNYGEVGWRDRRWSFLTTDSVADLEPILQGYGQTILAERDESGAPTGLFTHVLKVFLVDRQGRVRNIYSASFLEPALVLADLETLALEDQAVVANR